MRRLALAGLVLAGALAGCGGSSCQGTLCYSRQRPLAVQTEPAAGVPGATVEHLTYAAADGQRVPALFSVPSSGVPPYACLIYQGGIAATKEQARFLFSALAEHGVAAFTIDPRYTGERGDNGALAAALRTPAGVLDYLRGTALDLRRALDLLEADPRCDRARLGYAGVSFGAIEGVIVAGNDTRVRATVLMSVGGTLRDLVENGDLVLPGTPRDAASVDHLLAELAPFDLQRTVARISPRALLFVVGRHDPIVPLAAARRLYDAAGPPKSLFVHDGGHDPFSAPDVAQVLTTIGAFLQRTLIG